MVNILYNILFLYYNCEYFILLLIRQQCPKEPSVFVFSVKGKNESDFKSNFQYPIFI